METNKILKGDAKEKLSQLPDKSINMCVTSPPYWALRDYGEGTEKIWDEDPNCEHKFEDNFCQKCGAWKGQLGLEPNFDLYIKHLVDVFEEVGRVLRDDGTIFVNLGDTYFGGGNNRGNKSPISHKQSTNKGATGQVQMDWSQVNYPSKSLVMIPFRFAIEMVNRGWILRNTIIWHKPSCMPSSVSDRFTVDYEYIFFFSKKKKYYFEQQLEEASQNRWGGNKPINTENSKDQENQFAGLTREREMMPKKRNKRTTWHINPKPFKEAHFAVFPPELVRTPIKAGCPKEVCKNCEKPKQTKRVPIGEIQDADEGVYVDRSKPYAVVERDGYVAVRDLPELEDLREYLKYWRKKSGYSVERIEEIMDSQAPHHWFSGESYPTKDDWIRLKDILNFDDKYDKNITEVKYKSAKKLETNYKERVVSCKCNERFRPGIVLDPFIGVATTAIEAINQGKNFIGIEMSQKYIDIAWRRINQFNEKNGK